MSEFMIPLYLQERGLKRLFPPRDGPDGRVAPLQERGLKRQ